MTVVEPAAAAVTSQTHTKICDKIATQMKGHKNTLQSKVISRIPFSPLNNREMCVLYGTKSGILLISSVRTKWVEKTIFRMKGILQAGKK